ncbi:MAG: hypothetical protein RL226_488 [Bacteroidota bacterium]
MAMYRFFFLLIFVFLSLSSGAKSTLKGSAPELSGGELFVYFVDNAFTDHELLLQSVTVNEDGTFSCSFTQDRPGRIRIYIREWKSEFYALPEREYEIHLAIPKTNFARTFCDNLLDTRLSSTGTSDPNVLLSKFQSDAETLFGESYFDLAVKQSKGGSGYRETHKERLLSTNIISDESDEETVAVLSDSTALRFDLFARQTRDRLVDADMFTRQVILSALAELDLELGKPNHEILRDYTDVLPDIVNPEYVRLFRQMYSEPLRRENVTPDRWAEIITTSVDPQEALTVLESLSDKGFSDEQRIMLLLLALEQSEVFSGVSKRQVYSAINRWSSDERCGVALSHLRDRALQGSVGDKEALPDITLLTAANERFNLQSLKGEGVYVLFVNSNAPTSVRELAAVEMLIEEFHKSLRFVVVDVGDGKWSANMQKLWKAGKVQLLQSGNIPAVRYHFNLKAAPTGYLISPANAFMYDSTPLPSQGLAVNLERITKPAGGGGKGPRTWRD